MKGYKRGEKREDRFVARGEGQHISERKNGMPVATVYLQHSIPSKLLIHILLSLTDLKIEKREEEKKVDKERQEREKEKRGEMR